MHHRTILKLHAAGELPGVRISERTIRFRVEDIEAYEAKRIECGGA